MAAPNRSLADDIRGRSDDELVALVLARPDLARPAPADLTGLAARASTRASVQRAVEALDLGHLHVLEALVVAGEAASATALLGLLGVDSGDRAGARLVATCVDDLWTAALVWRAGRDTHVVRTVEEVLGASVSGLGAPWSELRPAAPALDPEGIAAKIEQAPGPARAILDRLTWGPAVAVPPTGPAGRTAVRWLLEQSLLVTVASDRVTLPREVGLVLRGGRLHRDARLRAPDLPAKDVSAPIVDAVAGGAASDLLVRVDELAGAWGAQPPRVLRAGGLSQRDLKLTEQALDLEPERAAFIVEIAYAAGLVGDDGDVVPVWAPTAELDEWSASAGGDRWARLGRAWLGMIRAPHLVGRRVADSPVNALGPGVQWPAIRGIRRAVLAELARLPQGHAPTADDLRELLLWRRPLRPAGPLADAVEGVLRQAEWLGVTGRGALSSPGRALVAADTGRGDGRLSRDASVRGTGRTEPNLPDLPDLPVGARDPAAAMAPHLPEPVDHILVQADLTAVAPGPLEGDLAAFMRLTAEIESRGGATVHRFTTASIRRALDAGWTAAALLDTLRAASRTPIPQPLEYLVSDVARKHGQTRVGSSAAYLRSDDAATLERMVAARELAPLRLRRIAPTVLVSSADPAVLVDLLREHGFAPVLEAADGGVLVNEPARRRARTRRPVSPPVASPVDETFTRDLVSDLRAGEASAVQRRAEEANRPGPAIPATDPVVTLAVLRDAIAERHGVWIGVTDRLGATTRQLVHPRRVEGGRVWAADEAGHEHTWSVHRITGATLA